MLHRPTEQIPPLLPSSASGSSSTGVLSTSQPPVNQSPQNLVSCTEITHTETLKNAVMVWVF